MSRTVNVCGAKSISCFQPYGKAAFHCGAPTMLYRYRSIRGKSLACAMIVAQGTLARDSQRSFSPSTPSTAKYAKKKRTASGKPGAGALLGFLGVLGGTWRTWRETSL